MPQTIRTPEQKAEQRQRARVNRRAIRARNYEAACVAAQECKMVVDDVSKSRFGARQYEYTEKPTALARELIEQGRYLFTDRGWLDGVS